MEYVNVYNEKYINLLQQRQFNIKVRFEILDWSENTIDEIVQDIKSDSIGTITANYQQGIRRTISFSLYDYKNEYSLTEDSPFQVFKKFKLYLGLVDNEDIYWYEQGVFITKNISYDNNLLTVEAVDKFAVFTEELGFCCLQETYVIPYGVKVKTIIKDILLLQSSNYQVYDSIEPIIDINYVDVSLPYEIKKESGSYLGDVLIEIATALNADIYYDVCGHLRISKAKNTEYKNVQPKYHYQAEDLIQFKMNVNLNESKNIFTVYGYDELGLLHQYTAKNDNPLSPVRISLVGGKADTPEENEMCTNDETCRDYAEYKSKQNCVNNLSCSFNSHIIPHIDVDDTVAITDNYFNFDYVLFIVKSLTIPLGIESVSVQAVNIQWLPDYTQDIYYTNITYDKCKCVITVNISNIENEFSLPAFSDISETAAIDWGDDNSSSEDLSQTLTHSYSETGTYNISIKSINRLMNLSFKGRTDITKLSFNKFSYFNKSVINIEPFSLSYTENISEITFSDYLIVNIGNYAFMNNSSLTNIVLPDDTEYIGGRAFYNCTSLKSITIGKNTKQIGYKVFEGCTSLEIIHFNGNQSEWNKVKKNEFWNMDNIPVEFI